ncbi:MAG: hypothetical protein P8Z31_11210, partial [Gammaproteobacteria bacterium]
MRALVCKDYGPPDDLVVDEDLALACDRVVHLFDHQVVRGTVVFADECPHQATSNRDAAPCPPPM